MGLIIEVVPLTTFIGARRVGIDGTRWIMAIYYAVKSVLHTLRSLLSIATDAIGDTVRRTLFDDVIYCPGSSFMSILFHHRDPYVL